MNPVRLFIQILPVLLLLPCFCADAGAVEKTAPSRLVVGLEDAVSIGMKQNRDIEVARLDREMAGQKVREAWSEVFPHISSNFTYTRSLKPTVMFFPDIFNGTGQTTTIEVSQDNAAVASLNLNQTLFKLSAIAGIRASSLVRKISEESYRQVCADVESRIRKAYYDALIAGEKLRLIEQSIARWEQSRRDTKALFRQGIAADIDTLKAYLSVENLKPDLIRAQSGISIASTRLKTAIGVDQGSELVLSDSLVFREAAAPIGVDAAYAEALEKRPDVRGLGLQVKAEGEQITAARSEGFPLLSAFGQLDAQTQFDDGTELSDTRWPVSSSIGLQLSLPIFSGFGTSSKVAQARIGQLQTKTRFEELKNQVRADVEVRLATLLETRKRIDVQSKTIAVAERSYRITRLRFREGIGSQLELTDSELQLNTAKNNYLQAVYDYLVASVEFEKSLGRTVPLSGRY
jgi:outer membrane protein TolC